MSDNNNNSNDDSQYSPPKIEKFSEEEKKEIIDKMKQFLAAEDGDKVILYAALQKAQL